MKIYTGKWHLTNLIVRSPNLVLANIIVCLFPSSINVNRLGFYFPDCSQVVFPTNIDCADNDVHYVCRCCQHNRHFLSTPIPTGPDNNFIACSVEHKWQMKAGCNALIRIIILLFFLFQTRHSVILPQHLTEKEKA